jgi:hypothetical protein
MRLSTFELAPLARRFDWRFRCGLRAGRGRTTLSRLAPNVEGRLAGRCSLKPLVFLIAWSAVACGSEESTPDTDPSIVTETSHTFAGPLTGTDAMLAAVQSGPDWVFYVCGGPATQATLTRWLQARVDPESRSPELAATDRGVSIVAAHGSGSITGTLEDAAGVVYSFQADRIDAPSSEAAGLYSALDSGCRTGLVVVPSGSGEPRRIQGVWCDSMGRVGQVTPIEPVTLDQRGLAVLAGPDERLLHLVPAIPPL